MQHNEGVAPCKELLALWENPCNCTITKEDFYANSDDFRTLCNIIVQMPREGLLLLMELITHEKTNVIKQEDVA